ncbi:succinate dehydrogenase, hydrophobic membrane anchor protein [Rubellimicrobium sp. CFH 75288]|uniref:succinate dehydrogenase, hydrophobic membrane anchor protein n=1 Tax=Rubellimicrobium sp. CFH 75288 TaxID=2697034 RepID=UPI001412D121|nr:succinate dehydrogenase, hydrophobic membrane anchor protein [Rubellimicrobium sp. CFH 75288]NAZ38200.1 succinate dehydrogenase, hydrophobic membrane anchor protein [Rubellimicrobium sp. CFH 75288]
MGRFVTARKRAENLGASGAGTEHFWQMIVSSVALAVLLPVFAFTFGSILGLPYEAARAEMARPFPALVTALTLLVGLWHFRQGAQVVAEDYAHGLPRKALVIATVVITYGVLAVGLFAVARLAL